AARLDIEVGRSEDSAGDEDLTAACVDHRHRAGRTRGERVERRDSGRWNVEGEPEPAGRREADPDAREAAWADPDRESLDVSRVHPRLAQQRVDVLEQRHGAG